MAKVKQVYACPQAEVLCVTAEVPIAASAVTLPGTEWLDMEEW